MVPYDQPVAIYELVRRHLENPGRVVDDDTTSR